MAAAKTYEAIHVEKDGGITWLMINRPDKRNAMSPQLHFDMCDVLNELESDAQTKVLVLTGAGEACPSQLAPGVLRSCLMRSL